MHRTAAAIDSAKPVHRRSPRELSHGEPVDSGPTKVPIAQPNQAIRLLVSKQQQVGENQTLRMRGQRAGGAQVVWAGGGEIVTTAKRGGFRTVSRGRCWHRLGRLWARTIIAFGETTPVVALDGPISANERLV